ncbi:hypothetical protein MKY96_32745 [Paenibacillus sp. FSL R7-0302]|uniref:hypothetical protein n=1 Tax=Paenibacillus sp. FSL R7-0302 TaxID=2921681 RepID=UPI0030FB1F4E
MMKIDNELILLPKEDLLKRKAMLENLLSTTIVDEFSYFIGGIISGFGQQITSQECEIPSYIQLGFEEEWNDGDATYPTISGVSLLNQDEVICDADICEVQEEELYFELWEYISEAINEKYNIRELEKHLGTSPTLIKYRKVDSNV